MGIPHFEYDPSNAANKYIATIKLLGEVIHRIDDTNVFYKYFGYTENEAKLGILPEEFIWQEYVNNRAADFSACAQMHIIEYLEGHSEAFRKQFGSQCKEWFDAHAKIRLERGIKCVACKMKPFCEEV